MTVPAAHEVPATFPVVALIASAGGVEALMAVLAELPRGLPAAVLVALHQEPNRPSAALAKVLQRRAALPVAVARDGDVLEPGRVLVAPPGHHLLVTSAAGLGLIETGSLPPARPSADLLLTTLAVTCGSRALAVVLTGLGHDGQAGVRAIAHRGGRTIAQDEASSRFPDMPKAAVETALVTEVAPLAGMAAAIERNLESMTAGGHRLMT